jgi:hypothetical protein
MDVRDFCSFVFYKCIQEGKTCGKFWRFWYRSMTEVNSRESLDGTTAKNTLSENGFITEPLLDFFQKSRDGCSSFHQRMVLDKPSPAQSEAKSG